MEEGSVVEKLEFFQRSEPLHSVLYFGRQPDSYMSSILKKLVTMNDPTTNLSGVLVCWFFFVKTDIFFHISYVLQ